MKEKRELLFISHANPEDNEFTLWLASRLTSLGYLVWTDLTELFGAEIFWSDIEEAIREYAVKFIAVLSHNSQKKDGVLDEIQVAVSVEKKVADKRFVVPIRIDDLNFTDVKINLGRKNIIDFRENWADGFYKLVKVLKRDDVPCSQKKSDKETSEWISKILAGPEKIINKPENILSNWFSFSSLPEKLNVYRTNTSSYKLYEIFKEFHYPVSFYQNMIITFANIDDLKRNFNHPNDITFKDHLLITDILEKKKQNRLDMDWPDLYRRISFLIKTAWDKSIEKKGLIYHTLPGNRKAWYLKKEKNINRWIHYLDMFNVERRKKLVGHSNKRRVYWHYAMEASPLLENEIKIALKPHVIFSNDGSIPIDNNKRMQVLRRGFCRNWWNERWRDLMLAYMANLKDNDNEIFLLISSNQILSLNIRPIMFQSLVSLSGTNRIPNVEAEDETDEMLDKLDIQNDWDIEEDLEEYIDANIEKEEEVI